MAEASVTRTLDATPDDLWKLVSDFGDLSWLPGGGVGAEIEGSGPGMVRVLVGPEGKIRERLESVDEAGRSIRYAIPEGVPFPVTDYRATMQVSDDGGRARLAWSCRFEPDGATEAEAARAIETMYGVMMGWIQERLGGQASP